MGGVAAGIVTACAIRMKSMPAQRPITLLICALGGEGGGTLTQWLVEVARSSGFAAQSTSIPGVAQRTGATTYYLEVFPTPLVELQGRRPVFSLTPVPGAIDALVSSELLETARQVTHGMSSAGRTLIISSSSRTLTTAERMVPGDGRIDHAPLLQSLLSNSRLAHVFDMTEMAQASGTVVSAVMLGAIAGSGLLPFPRKTYQTVVAQGGRTADASLRGFERAFEHVHAQQNLTDRIGHLLDDAKADARANPGVAAQPAHVGGVSAMPASDLAAVFPAPVQSMLALGYARMLDYQGQSYADLYISRLKNVLEAERRADPDATRGHATTVEIARWLALWMAFDDIVRVAQLKSRSSRWQRLADEVKVKSGDVLRVYDFFKPGVAEFAALLPQGMANAMLRWERLRVANGQTPLALSLKIASHTVLGTLLLRLLAGLRWLRPRGSRYMTEQALIEKWLDRVVQGTTTDWKLGHEIALCGRLIKGYGSTNERGKENLLHVLDHLTSGARFPDPEKHAQAIADVRSAALQDEAGKAFDMSLVRHGAPARVVKTQPIRWVKRATSSP